MRYNELNLIPLLPDGQPVNEESHVESRGYINAFFLRAFEWWYGKFSHYALSFAAPYNLEACMACNQAELQKFIEEAGVRFYNTNATATNAAFANALFTIPWGTPPMVEAFAKYILNSPNTTGSVDYNGLPPHHYTLLLDGELDAAELTPEILTRISDAANDLAPVTEKLDGVVLTEAAPIAGNITDIAARALRICEVELEIPVIAPQLFFTINKTTGAETVGNGIFEPVLTPKGGEVFESNKTPRLISYQTDELSVPKGGEVFDGEKTPALQNLGNNLFFTITKTPDA